DEIYGRLPRVHMSVDLTESLRFNDLVEVELRVEALGSTSLTYGFDIRKDGRPAASGRMIAVLLERSGEKEEWTDRHRSILTTSGRQEWDGP
ncbi:MAG TPA: hotdog domain-containing protein, partial [Actinomycetota bacterium]|nr:hotdog domain-containing protein [Actinomycetota bacterium]